MTVVQLNGVLNDGLASEACERREIKKVARSFNPVTSIDKRKLSFASAATYSHPSAGRTKLFPSLVSPCRKRIFPVVSNKCSSDYDVGPSEVERISPQEEHSLSCSIKGLWDSTEISTSQSHSQSIKSEFIMLSLPAIAGQAIEPLAQLMETAYIGRLGAVELASAGVSISVFNIISKLFNIPLLSVATSYVAQDISRSASKESLSDEFSEGENNNGKPLDETTGRKQLPAVSTALFLAVGIGTFEAIALCLGSGLFLSMMGISSASSMRIPAQRFLSLRAFGAPAVVIFLALQGVFRGFKDTKTPLLCLGVGNLSAVFLFPILMYYFRLGVTGAAISTVASQYIVSFLMIWFLNKRVVLLPPKLENLHFGDYLRSGGYLIGRTLAVLSTMTLGTSMAARQGPLAMAAHQICLQVWLAVSLLTDALAASGQALIATSYSKGDYATVKEVTNFVLKIGLLTGVFLAAVLGISFGSLATLFTKDAEVLAIARSGLLFVSASQPINALAFIFDGLHYGVSDFSYAARSMMVVGAISSAFLLFAPYGFGLSGVWLGLALFMGLRMVAGYIRLISKTGPWWFLQKDFLKSEGGANDAPVSLR